MESVIETMRMLVKNFGPMTIDGFTNWMHDQFGHLFGNDKNNTRKSILKWIHKADVYHVSDDNTTYYYFKGCSF